MKKQEGTVNKLDWCINSIKNIPNNADQFLISSKEINNGDPRDHQVYRVTPYLIKKKKKCYHQANIKSYQDLKILISQNKASWYAMTQKKKKALTSHIGFGTVASFPWINFQYQEKHYKEQKSTRNYTDFGCHEEACVAIGHRFYTYIYGSQIRMQ